MNMNYQYTLGGEFSRSGVGLHSGIKSHVKIMSAPQNTGRYFVRIDLPNYPVIPAIVSSVISTTLSTELGTRDIRIRTVEHLLAALAGMGIDNARIEIDSPEIPLLDGSAKVWTEAIASIGLVKAKGVDEKVGKWRDETIEINNTHLQQLKAHKLPVISQPVWIYQGDSFVAALPSLETRFTYGIDFDLPAIGNQWYSWSPQTESFTDSIAPARTFGLSYQIDQLREAGLIKGGSLDNALVCSETGWLNPPLRFTNEPVRHKILDLIGDLSLLGSFPQAHYFAYKASHKLHIQLAQKISELN
ncbi:MAG: UDP-3-O-acyl-N-acetylglucosamine deacetylase [Trichodesmium sp. St16_bin4-tuft]|nr:UDP-3-O-acyl-N-acetylglucosamine deacetylase [Trichodesmium sp. MAG_R01]MDE5078312.1 UDP-3-O-acyl-N-acetylglucosamine deacetylase [Trichodesmium sp. St2_bin6]MDE5091126.1 UDP-3-O-acyl-N-acetylglucosamine deacetylase [Trichodesmium sp. St18_bin3_1_1]MDE5101345.1 UDP-3-O-acyl-N-acetylglucosamine deacetylase [Trichodesmium sp. St16_bin4-tuft]MDE5102808.1 UDP-3-O-acyl-N-acetylglucosamine deacetylase [Trichodesmium sp. St19_bin2]